MVPRSGLAPTSSLPSGAPVQNLLASKARRGGVRGRVPGLAAPLRQECVGLPPSRGDPPLSRLKGQRSFRLLMITHQLREALRPALPPQVGSVTTYTYRDLQREVSRVANVLKSFGVRKGDNVAV